MQYNSIVARLYEHFDGMPVRDLRPRDISRYVTDKLDVLSAATVCRDLTILGSILRWAVRLELLDRNPAEGIPYPKATQRKGVALKPVEVQALARSFTNEQDRLAFLTFVITGLRRSEPQALRWRDVDLIDNRLRVVDSKTDTGERSIAIPPVLAEELWQHQRRSPYNRDQERVFCHQERGSVYSYETFSMALRAAYEAAGMQWPEGMRPCHDLRVTSLTNGAIAGESTEVLMTRAGHANYATTRRYVNLAGVVFQQEAATLEDRLLNGGLSTEASTRLTAPSSTSRDASGLRASLPTL